MYLFFLESNRKIGLRLMLCTLLTHAIRDTVLINIIIFRLSKAMPIYGTNGLYVFWKSYMDMLWAETDTIIRNVTE